jgi:hypothetical protein
MLDHCCPVQKTTAVEPEVALFVVHISVAINKTAHGQYPQGLVDVLKFELKCKRDELNKSEK